MSHKYQEKRNCSEAVESWYVRFSSQLHPPLKASFFSLSQRLLWSPVCPWQGTAPLAYFTAVFLLGQTSSELPS